MTASNASLLLDQVPVATWDFSALYDGTPGTNQLGAINFVSIGGAFFGTSGEYYLDDVLFSKTVLASIMEPGTAQYQTYPNPAQEMLFVEFPTPTRSAVAELFDTSGRSVLRMVTGPAVRMEMDLHGLPPGAYSLRLSAGGVTTTRKVMKT